jgi:hypothetical protein
MPNVTVSSDIHSFMQASNKTGARNSLDIDKCFIATGTFISTSAAGATPTPVNVDNLAYPVASGEKVFIEVLGFQNGTAAGAGMSINFTGPANPAFVRYSLEHYRTATQPGVIGIATGFSTVLVDAAGTMECMPFRCPLILVNGNNAGTVQFQATSENSSTTVHISGAIMRVNRIP